MNTPEDPGDPDELGLETDRSYANEAVRGSAWIFLQTAIRKGLAIVVQLILARLLFPSDFGLVAIAVGTAALVQVVGPGSMIDLLVQRGPHLPNAIHNARRLAFASAITIGIAVLAAALIVSHRPGQSLKTIGSENVTSETLLDQISADPTLPELLKNAVGTFQLDVGDKWVDVRLPTPPSPDTSVGDYSALMQATIDKDLGADEVHVIFVEEQARIQITNTDGIAIPVRSRSSSEGAVLDTLGIAYKSQPLLWLLVLLAFRPLMWAVILPYAGVLRLKLRFAAIAKANVVANTTGQLAAVALAFLGTGSLALMIPHLVHPALLALFFYLIARPLPRARNEDYEAMKTIVADSASLWIAQWIHSATLQVPNLILAFFVSSREVGYFYFAFLLSVQLIALLSQNLSSALTPIFSNLQGQPERLTSGLLRSAGAIAGVTIPLFLGAAAAAPIFVPVIFGERWTPAIPLLMILLVALSFATTGPPTASFLKSTGRYRTWLVLQVVQGTIFLGTVLLTSWAGGTVAVAWTILGQQMVLAPISIYLCVRGRARKRDILRIHSIPLIASIPMIPVGIVIYTLTPGLVALLVWCPILLLSAGALYVLVIRLLDRTRYDEVSSILNSLKGKLLRTIGVGRSHST